jgi:DNA topoisomerase-1
MNASPASIAHQSGLTYVTDDIPGIRRRRQGSSFAYLDPKGKPVKDKATLERIASLAVPPAYEDVWICPLPQGHIQATGRDARGRKQYRYHPHWREVRDETKYARMLDFARALPTIRRRVESDLRHAGLGREKILAAIVRLLETTAIRVGNDEYARENHSFGLTTLRNRHAQVKGERVTFRFKGKSGVEHAIDLHDRRLAKILHACQDLPGQQLFEYVGDDDAVHRVDSNDVNAYIREISGGDFTAKDFRTWLGTVQCALALSGAEEAANQAARKSRIVDAIKHVAQRLGNTPAVCRKAYVHPEVLAAYLEEGSLGDRVTTSATQAARSRGLTQDERFLVSFLRKRLKDTPEKRTRRKLRESLTAKTATRRAKTATG